MLTTVDNDVVLNIYELTQQQNNEQQQNNAPRMAGFFNRVLQRSGLGTYHTSLTVRKNCYSFAAVSGITKTSTQSVPGNAIFQESITVGQCAYQTQGEINEIINNLREFFHGTSYHLINRNCNHFTETFATALLLGDDDCLTNVDPPKVILEKYPLWVNRLAKTGTSLKVLNNDNGDICNVWLEARKVTGADQRVRNDLASSTTTNSKTSGNNSNKVTRKKELTEKQKAILAKLKKKSNT